MLIVRHFSNSKGLILSTMRVNQVMEFCASVGLPMCLEDVGLPSPSREDIRKVAEATTAEGETIHATWFPVTADLVEAAIWAADALGKGHKAK